MMKVLLTGGKGMLGWKDALAEFMAQEFPHA